MPCPSLVVVQRSDNPKRTRKRCCVANMYNINTFFSDKAKVGKHKRAISEATLLHKEGPSVQLSQVIIILQMQLAHPSPNNLFFKDDTAKPRLGLLEWTTSLLLQRKPLSAQKGSGRSHPWGDVHSLSLTHLIHPLLHKSPAFMKTQCHL